MKKRVHLLAFAILVACAGDDTEIDFPDSAPNADGASPDSSIPNDARADSTIADATIADASDAGAEIDSTIPDAESDSTLTDSSELDSTILDSSSDTLDETIFIVDSSSDTSVVDSSVTDSSLPDSSMADSGPQVCAAQPGCPVNEKLCSGACVLNTDLTFGCDPSACGSPCNLPNSVTSCSGTSCQFVSCHAGFADCNNDPTDGCEADLSTVATCGSCGASCGNGQECSATGCTGTCNVTQCGDKCVNPSTSIAACGACGQPCQDAHGSGSCSSGSCTITCDSGYSLCNGTCVDTNNDVNHCGSCSACSASGDGATATCNAGACDVVCQPGYAKCGSICVNENTDANNCGACGSPCSAGQWCVSGSCQAPSVVQVLTGLSQPSDIAADGTNVYWSELGGNEIFQADVVTFTKAKIATNQNSPERIAINSAAVFWSNTNGNTIASVPIGGGSVTVIANANAPLGIAADANEVYWYDSGTGQILKAPIAADAGAPSLVASLSGTCSELRVDSSDVWCTITTGTTRGLYAFNKVTGSIDISFADTQSYQGQWSTPIGTCAIRQVVASYFVVGTCGQNANFNVHTPTILTGDSCAVYGSDGSSAIWKFAPTAVALTTNANVPSRLVGDANNVYWVDVNWIGRIHK